MFGNRVVQRRLLFHEQFILSGWHGVFAIHFSGEVQFVLELVLFRPGAEEDPDAK
jgi:hypothetical protein